MSFAQEMPEPRRARLRDVRLTPRRLVVQRVFAGLLVGLALLALGVSFAPEHTVYTDRTRTTVEAVHTAYDHQGPGSILVLLAIASVAVRFLVQPTFARGMVAAVAEPILVVAYLATIFDLDHMFEHVEYTNASLFGAVAFFGLFFLALAGPVLVPVLYAGARRARERIPASPLS